MEQMYRATLGLLAALLVGCVSYTDTESGLEIRRVGLRSSVVIESTVSPLGVTTTTNVTGGVPESAYEGVIRELRDVLVGPKVRTAEPNEGRNRTRGGAERGAEPRVILKGP